MTCDPLEGLRRRLRRCAGPMAALACGLAALPASLPVSGQGAAVVVNGQPLPTTTVRSLEAAYRVPVRPGRYWYDAFSGAWGTEGGPIAGQLAPGLRLGGPLRAGASHGTSQVFVNGRELTVLEVLQIQQACRTPVLRGRYWVDARGRGGFEGRGMHFDLNACFARRGGGGGGGSSTRTYCDGAGNCSSHGLWGWVGTVR